MEADVLIAATGQSSLDSAALEPIVKMVEDSLEGRGGNPPDYPGAGRKAPVGTDQMFAPCGHRKPYRRVQSGWQAPDLPLRVQRFTVNRHGNGKTPLVISVLAGKVAPLTRDAALTRGC
jgi:hypothetical protein